MKDASRGRALLRQVCTLLLSWRDLSRGPQLLLVALSYVLGVTALWLFFPPTHNESSLFLPLVSACWLFRYRGLLTSLLLNGIIFQVTSLLPLRGILPDRAFVEGGIIGVLTSLGLGLVVCWLRTTVDHLQEARKQARVAEHERLETALKERQATLAYEQQRTLNALKDQFLVNVNHELRTPLTILGGTLELFKEQDASLDSQTRASFFNEALASQEELLCLVNRVLDATRVVSDISVVHAEAVNISQALQEVLAHLAPQDLAGYTIQVQVDEQMLVWVDPQFMRQVLRNLFSNIFKYVPMQTEICIEATQADPTSPVCLSMQDEGPGIPADELPLLFEKFSRLKRDLTSATRGTGLGLYICKQMIEAMGGRIWVESSGRVGKGSRFCLLLPPVAPT